MNASKAGDVAWMTAVATAIVTPLWTWLGGTEVGAALESVIPEWQIISAVAAMLGALTSIAKDVFVAEFGQPTDAEDATK